MDWGSPWWRKLWPVHRHECKKVIPLLLLKFLISVVYSILTCMKDTLVVTSAHSGAEVIPILKGWLVFPLAILCAILYAKLLNHFKRSTLFYWIVSCFLSIVLLYGFVLYPYADSLSPHRSADWLVHKLGSSYSHWIAVYRHWAHSLFFITAELWAQLVIFTLYWGLANDLFKIQEAKRTYTLFIAAGDLGAIVSAPLTLYYVNKYLGQGFIFTLQALVGYAIACGLCILALYWWMNCYLLRESTSGYQAQTDVFHQRTKLTLRQSIRHIMRSKYLLAISVLVIGCAITINMVEVTWKAYLKILHPTPEAYQAFVAKSTLMVGSAALVTVLLFGGHSLRIFGWHVTAQVTPIVIGVTGVAFFILCIYEGTSLAIWLKITPLVLIVFVGAFQNIISKVVKYSFFDSTKEMAYIPLDQESKHKGKAAIDMVGSRLGKSGSSLIQIVSMQLVGTGSIILVTPILLPTLIVIAGGWIYSVAYLNRAIKEKDLEREKQLAAALQEEMALQKQPLQQV